MGHHIERFRLVHQHTVKHPELHSQSAFKKTGADGVVRMCAAGRAVDLSGQFDWPATESPMFGTIQVYPKGKSELSDLVYVDEAAAAWLGMTSEECELVFNGGMSDADAVEWFAEQIAAADMRILDTELDTMFTTDDHDYPLGQVQG